MQKKEGNAKHGAVPRTCGGDPKQPIGYRIATVFAALLFIAGAGILLYPTISNLWNTFIQRQLISSYSDTVNEYTDEELEEMWEEAYAYNEAHGESNIYADEFNDAFEEEEQDLDSEWADEVYPSEHMENSEYWKVLNPNGDGIMGYISIPKINIDIPIYHGTPETILKYGAGHMCGSNLPIGGEGNHAVLAAHRGLPSAKLFSDLNKLEEGDAFYLSILDETFAYEVDQILPMVEMDDADTLFNATTNVEGEDYVTLFTCTPYGVNTHRLLVRGHRIPYVEEEIEEEDNSVVRMLKDYYLVFLIAGIIITITGICIIRHMSKRKAKKSQEDF